MKKIVFLEPLGLPGDTLQRMARQAVGRDAEIVCCGTRAEDAQTLIERGRDADAVVLSNIPYPAPVMEKCPKLEYICVAFTGCDHVDTAYCRKRGIRVSNCAGYSTAAVAELALGLALALSRELLPCDGAVRRGGDREGKTGRELAGKKFGIVGAGAIGLRVAALARAFGCEVLACSRTKKDVEGVSFTDLDTLLSACDIVSLHVPQTPETRGLIGREQLARMKKTAFLINTARGPIVDSDALARALDAGDIAGAGIDVFESEPPLPPGHPLLHAKNCIVTPHIGFATEEAMARRAEIVCANLKAYLAGAPVHLVG